MKITNEVREIVKADVDRAITSFTNFFGRNLEEFDSLTENETEQLKSIMFDTAIHFLELDRIRKMYRQEILDTFMKNLGPLNLKGRCHKVNGSEYDIFEDLTTILKSSIQKVLRRTLEQTYERYPDLLDLSNYPSLTPEGRAELEKHEKLLNDIKEKLKYNNTFFEKVVKLYEEHA